jgi:cytoskeletal protein RodZ
VAALSVGATLQAQRIRKALSIDDIARQTKIPERYLKAIEADRFEVLPGIIFARNFVRQYAASIDLDGTALAAHLPSYDLAAAPMPVAPVRLESRSVWDPRWNSALTSFVWILLAGAAVGAAYVYFNRPAHVPAYAAAAPSSPESAPRPSPELELAPVTPAVAENPPAATAPVPEAAPRPSPVDESRPDAHPVRVLITAHQDAWIQVFADGKTVFTGTLKSTDAKTFSADDYVKVVAGNAGGIDISLNGKPLDPLGPAGQVRSVRLTAEGPQFPPKSPPVSDPV